MNRHFDDSCLVRIHFLCLSPFMDRIKRLDKYLLLEQIGHGGFASVYKCRDDESGTIYAIKIGKEKIDDEYREKATDVNAMTHMEEWHAYKAVNYGKGVANRRGIPDVVETGPMR